MEPPSLPLPSDSFTPNLSGNFELDILELFRWGVMISLVLGVIFTVIAGFQYATTDAFGKKMDIKVRLKEILIGMALALCSVLILETINPRLVNVSLSTIGGGVPIGIADPNMNISRHVDRNLIIVDANKTEYGNQQITGSSVTVTSGVRVDTDGKTRPPFSDPDWSGETSLPGLDANVDNYVVVPIGSEVPLGTRVYVYNHDTGTGAYAVVGDRGPTANGYGEMSLNLARQLGAWTEGMGNAAKEHTVTYTFDYVIQK